MRITNPGQNYDSAILTIESPQLPGGSTATASIEVSGGKIYNAEVSLSGFGYTEAPSVVVKALEMVLVGVRSKRSLRLTHLRLEWE